jgi:hypothetical protein
MTSRSVWLDIDVAADAEALEGVAECHVAVSDSGIAGISTAYELCTTSSIRRSSPFHWSTQGASRRSGQASHGKRMQYASYRTAAKILDTNLAVTAAGFASQGW